MEEGAGIVIEAPAGACAGDTVRGVVEVISAPAAPCTELVARLSRRVGRTKRPTADVWHGVAETALVEHRDLDRGERIPFALEVPVGSPPSFDGKLVEVGWRLEASARFRGMGAPVVETRAIRVGPAPIEEVVAPEASANRGGGYRAAASAAVAGDPLSGIGDPTALGGPLGRMRDDARRSLVDLARAARWYRARRTTASAFLWLVVALTGICVGVMIPLGILAGFLALPSESAKGTGFLVFFGLAGYGASLIARDWLRETALPRWRDRGVSLALVAPPRIAALGERASFAVRVAPRGQDVSALRYELVTVEECAPIPTAIRRGNRRRAARRWSTRDTIVDAGALTIRAEDAASPGGTTAVLAVTLPSDGPSTVVEPAQVIRWEVRVHLETGVTRTVIAPLVVVPLAATARS